MATQAQIAANRRNAQHSTGPRTPEGKQKTRLNSLVHGLRAEDVVLPNEDRDVFDQLRAAFLAEYDPQDPAQIFCVDRMLESFWRSRRVGKLELGLFGRNEDFDVLARLSRYQTALDRDFYRALNELKALKKDEIGFARQNPPDTQPTLEPVEPEQPKPQPQPTPPPRYRVQNGKLIPIDAPGTVDSPQSPPAA